MEFSPEIPEQQESSVQGRTLQVDFSWKKFKALITENDDSQSKPIYIVDFKAFKPHLVFKSAVDNSSFASGTLHPISINADCEVRGQLIALKALKRFKTEYTHLSYAFSDTDTPVPMTWITTSSFKTWDFICLDTQHMPVAKFSANIWAVSKVGKIEFVGSRAASSDAIRDEIVVTGLTLFYCMMLRTSSILSLFGAIFSRPGRDDKNMPTAASEQLTGGDEDHVDAERQPGNT